MREYLYSIHETGLRLTTNSPAVASTAESFLDRFRIDALAGRTALDCILLGVHDRTEIPIKIPPSARLLSSHQGEFPGDSLHPEWKYDVYRERRQCVLDFHDQGLVAIHMGCRSLEGYLIEPETMYPERCHLIFRLLLTELLKGDGIYAVHAAAVEKGGRGVLLPGSSGRGKTTCAVSLIRGGYGYLGDDYSLLRENGRQLEILSFPMIVGVTERTLEFFPESRPIDGLDHRKPQKRSLNVEELSRADAADLCEPAFVVFPWIVDSPKSYLEPLPKSRALEELLPQGPQMIEEDTARRQFRALSNLVESAACYRLYFGEDVGDLPHLIDPLFDGG